MSRVQALGSLCRYLVARGTGKISKEVLVECPICNSRELDLVTVKRERGIRLPIVQCRACSIALLGYRLSEKSLPYYYAHIYCGGDGRSWESSFRRQYARGVDFLEFLGLALNVQQQEKFSYIEMGCSYGGILAAISERRDVPVFGIDYDACAIEHALQKVIQRGVFAVGGESEFYSRLLDESGKSGVVIILSHVLEHLYHPLEFIQKMRQSILQTSYVVIEVPAFSLENRRAMQLAHVTYFKQNTLIDLLELAEISVVASEVRADKLRMLGKVSV